MFKFALIVAVSLAAGATMSACDPKSHDIRVGDVPIEATAALR